MYLKEIQLENFKSFGKKVRIPFLPGFTAITGPNGSGKSNIVDAILFILGVRSPKMVRAERLTDLIHKGEREADYCKVSLVFDNSDKLIPIESDEVVLTRKIRKAPLPNNPLNYYSYFYVNGKAASLNEFIELLSAAGISENCIVQQGDVTAVVEMGSVHRRKIIDEIAGIAEFDAEIEKARKEREEVERNLEHIEIILGEIKKQIRQLKKDRDDAIKYKELEKELKRHKSMLAYKKRIEIEREMNEINKQIESYEKSRKNLEEEAKRLKKEYNNKALEFQEIEDKIAEMGGEELIEIKNKIDLLKEELIKSKEKINYYRMEIAENDGETKEIDSKIKKLEKEIKRIEKEIKLFKEKEEEGKKELEKLKKKLDGLKKEVEHSDEVSMNIGREIAKLRKALIESKEKEHEINLEIDRLIQQKNGLLLQFNEVKEKKESFETELNEIESEIREARQKEKEKHRSKERLETKLFQLKKEEATINDRIRELDKEIIYLQRELAKLKTKEDMTSFSRAAKAILDARDNGIIKGIHGSVAELVEVDEKYAKAIEIAAGRRAEAIIVDDDGVAAKCIEYLKKNNYGRATFLPLNKLMTGKPRGKALLAVRHEGVVGFAIDLVKYEPRYHAALWYVFGDTIVVKDMDTARELMGGIRIVTLDGDIIEASGAITGGSMEARAIFGAAERKKIGELATMLRNASQEQEELTKKLIEIKDEISHIEDELSSITFLPDENIERLEIRKKELKESLKVILKEFGEREREAKEIEEKLKEKEGESRKIKEEMSQLQDLLKEKENELMRIAKKEILKEIEEIKEKIEEMEKDIRNAESQRKTKEMELKISVEQKEELEKRLEKSKKKIQEMRKLLNEEEQRYQKNMNEMKAMEEVERKLTTKAKGLQDKRDKLYKEIVRLENEIDTVSTRIEATIELISKAKARLPTLEAALAEVITEEEFKGELPSIEEIKKKIKELEEKLEKMQPVNMRALEEYERQDERRKKFEEDVARLKEQEKNLIKLEEEIKKKKKESFFVVFNKINENFQKIYRELANGESELLLENPDEPFEGGLYIRVKPAGKRALHLNALSGGEKSIASLAFIFALQAYNPSPFYVLDEIDMFLDEKNADKVATMIANKAKDAQFIVISLRRITLQKANHIYGVTTIDEKSTIIGSINLNEIEKVVEVK
ncbi:MAG: chromosome segregation protein SMC [Thermoplasmata archaeon]|nr:MAG: chromosome segregation protein SMC [Thermoplasmata archaeon]